MLSIKDRLKDKFEEAKEFNRIKNLQREAHTNSRYKKFRRISRPKNMNKRIRNLFSQEFENGRFRNDIYFDLSPMTVVWIYVKNFVSCSLPAILFHLIILLIGSISAMTLGEPQPMPSGAIQILVILYSIGLVRGLRKTSDHMAYYNTDLIVSKYNINRTMQRLIEASVNPESNREFAVMEYYRKKFNKYILFPSMKELAVTEQIYQRAQKSSREERKELASIRKDRLAFYNTEEEHMAAKAIADWKQSKYGGKNEYVELAEKYKHRTTPAIRRLTEEIQNTNNIDIDLDINMDSLFD